MVVLYVMFLHEAIQEILLWVLAGYAINILRCIASRNQRQYLIINACHCRDKNCVSNIKQVVKSGAEYLYLLMHLEEGISSATCTLPTQQELPGNGKQVHSGICRNYFIFFFLPQHD